MSRTATDHASDRELARPMCMLAITAAGSGAVAMTYGSLDPLNGDSFLLPSSSRKISLSA